MRIALLAPLPPEQTGIADYAANLKAALESSGIEVVTPLAGVANQPAAAEAVVATYDWNGIDLVHAELGGGRLAEFHALRALRQRFATLPLSATVHDPERLVWKRAKLPWPLSLAMRLPSPMPQIATVMADPLCLHEERQLAQSLSRLITLTKMGAECLRARMHLPYERVSVIAHGNLSIAHAPMPTPDPLRLLYFGFIYRGKGIEDLLDALALCVKQQPDLANKVRLTLAGGSAPEMAFTPEGSYLEQLRARITAQGLQGMVDWKLDIAADAIAPIIQAHHVMILPYQESKKLSLLGAMRGTSGALSWATACGRGAITSDARAFAEEVSHGNGALYPQGNVSALAEQILALTKHPEKAAQWAEKAQALGRERQWSCTAERFQQMFKTLCKEARDVA